MTRREIGPVRVMLAAFVTTALGTGLLAGSRPEACQPAAINVLFDAVKTGDVTRVQALIESDPALVKATDATGRTPLHWAARGTSRPVLALLVEKGADVNALDRGGLAPIHSLAARGDTQGLTLLLDRGADVNLASAQRETALHQAAQAGRVGAVQMLLARKAGLELANAYGRTPLVLAAREMGGIQVIRVLLNAGANVATTDKFGDTALTLAAWRGSADVVDLLLAHKAPLPSGRQAIEVFDNAVTKGLTSLFHALPSAGVDFARDLGFGRSFMHSAAEGGSVTILDVLAARKLDPSKADAFGWTPLHVGADAGRAEAVSWLLAHGAAINARTTMGQTPYNIADDNGDATMKALLQKQGAETSAPHFPQLNGPYLGQKPPGRTPEIFAPGIVSAAFSMHSNVVFSPDGTEAFWSVIVPARGVGYGSGRTMVSRLVGGRWTYPKRAVFDGVPLDDVPMFHPDGQHLYDMAERPMPAGFPAGGEHIWVWDRGGADGWRNPRPVDATVNSLRHHWQFSVDRAGTLYFSSTWNGASGIFRSRLVNGAYAEPEHLGPRINATGAGASFPFIAPDGSYLLFTRGRDDTVISFPDSSGAWGEPMSLGPEYRGMLPVVSPDGKYLFIGRDQRSYWADAGIIGELKLRGAPR
jgi:ankyrin repeat protein